MLLRDVRHALRLVQPADARDARACSDVEHFERTVAERCYEEPLARRIDGDVIDTTRDPRQRDDLHVRERLRHGGRARGRTDEDKRQREQPMRAHAISIAPRALGSKARIPWDIRGYHQGYPASRGGIEDAGARASGITLRRRPTTCGSGSR